MIPRGGRQAHCPPAQLSPEPGLSEGATGPGSSAQGSSSRALWRGAPGAPGAHRMPAGLRPPTSCSLHLKRPSPLPHTPFQTRLEGQAHPEPLSQPRVGGPRPSWLFRLCLEQPTRPPSTGLHLREWGHSRQLLPQPPGGCTAPAGPSPFPLASRAQVHLVLHVTLARVLC